MGRTVIVIAGGYSVREYFARDLRDRGFVIGVNDSCISAACDVGLTMDRLWMENRLLLVRTKQITMYVRDSAAKNIRDYPMSIFTNDNKATVMSCDPTVLNGTNSGMCALNLAFQLDPARVYLLGFDMTVGPKGEHYWYPDYPWATPKAGKLRTWAKQYDQIAQQFKDMKIPVFNVNHRTALKAFPVISWKQFLKDTQ